MASWAKRLEDKPFHLIASHCQDVSSRKEVVAFLQANGFSGTSPNMTITKNGTHPTVQAADMKPYYLVFDHTGALRRHHMGGSYHGGDQLEMITWVDKLLEDAPVIWLGNEPFGPQKKFASQIAAGKSLGGAIKKLETLRAQPADDENKIELDRIHAGVTRWRDRQLAAALGCESFQPSEVQPRLKTLQRVVKGTSLAEPVDKAVAEAKESDALAGAIKLEKQFRKIVKAFERVKESKRTDVIVDRTVAKLETLLEESSGSRFSEAISDYLSNLR